MKITLENGEVINISKESYKALQDSVKKWPQEWDEVWRVNWYGGATSFNFNPNDDTEALKRGEIFKTEEEAEAMELRLLSMVNRWKPEEDERYYYWHFKYKKACEIEWGGSPHSDLVDYFMGNVHRTEKEALEWGKKYAEAWMILLND